MSSPTGQNAPWADFDGICPREFGLYTGAVLSLQDGARHEGQGAAMALSLDVSRTGDIVVVTCRGRIVFGEEADELRRVVLDLLKETKRIVLNLAGVGYIDSSGLGTLVASFISARHRKAEIKFAALSPRTHRVLTITNVDCLFEVYESTEQAIKFFGRHADATVGKIG